MNWILTYGGIVMFLALYGPALHWLDAYVQATSLVYRLTWPGWIWTPISGAVLYVGAAIILPAYAIRSLWMGERA